MEFVNFVLAMVVLIIAWRAVVVLLSRPSATTEPAATAGATATTTVATTARPSRPRPHQVSLASRRTNVRVRSTS